MNAGPLSKLLPIESIKEPESVETTGTTIELEAQGIMVYDRTSGDESHVSRRRGLYDADN